MRGLLGLSHQAAQVRLGAVAQVVLLNCAIAKVKEAQTKAKLAAGGALDHVVAFQHHQEAVRGALVKLQGAGHMGQAERRVALAQQVKNGKPMSDQLKSSKNFPAIVGQMLAVGEETGQMDTILLKLAEFYEEEVDSVVASITSIIEPLLIIVLGGMVGFIVISVFGPISNLSSSV